MRGNNSPNHLKDKKYVEMLFVDSLGRTHDIEVSPGRFIESLTAGKVIDGSSIGMTPIESSDLVLMPIEGMGFEAPWDPEAYVALCDIMQGDSKLEPFELNDRHILGGMVGKAREMGFEARAANEHEYFVMDVRPQDAAREMVGINKEARVGKMGRWESLTEDQAFYMCTSPIDVFRKLRLRIYNSLPLVRAEGEYAHHEVGSGGQQEITFKYKDPLGLADTTVLFKHLAKNLAAEEGRTHTFMPKPVVGINGSGTHYHFSLVDKDGNNLFYGDKQGNMSELSLHFIGGILEHFKGLTLGVAPTENSRKRLLAGYEAPINRAWGHKNRSALVRIPSYSTESAARIEFREPDNTGNPYKTLAFILAAGLDGIERGIDPGEPYLKNTYLHPDEFKDYSVPQTQDEAIKEFRKDTLFRDVMGRKAFDTYVELVEKRFVKYGDENPKWDAKNITGFEYKNYLMI
ncbi:MAG: glutamine synthetase family protein [Candidatus Aenigmatarchaeota archaeon]